MLRNGIELLGLFLVCDPGTKGAIGAQQGVWSKLLTASAPFRAVAFKTVSLDELTAAQYVATDPLDLEYLSWSPS